MEAIKDMEVLRASLSEVILMAKRAYRWKEGCKTLAATLESIEPLLTCIEQSSDHGNATCQAWLQDLLTLLVSARGIVQDCRKEPRVSCRRKLFLSYKIDTIHCKIEGKVCNLLEMQHIPSLPMAFDNNLFMKLKKSILSMREGATKTIGLKGSGGSGKTLLAKMVNNDGDIRKKYGMFSILWITVGQDALVSSIYGKMGNFLNDGIFERDISRRDLEAQRTYLMGAFKKNTTLVILDDIWESVQNEHPMIYWLDICEGNGSTTLLTTRDNSVLDQARPTERIEVQPLSKEESWKLFSFHAFQSNMSPSQEVVAIAMEICNECSGLPLALEVIGGALWNTTDESDWKHALSCLKRYESWTHSTTIEDKLYCRLKFSYDALSDDAKKCFLYFAAFPEDYHVPTKQLYSIWQAEDLFGLCSDEKTLHVGRMNLITLADRSLIDLDDDEKFAKVHDVMRDLAMHIIQDAKIGEWAYECQFEPGKVLETLPKIKETTKRVSFIGTHISNLDSQLCTTCHKLQICLLSSLAFDRKSEFLISLPGDFFSNMESLSYLNLSECDSLMELPESIKELKFLMHLDVSGCKSLKELPKSIKGLKFLMHLDVSGCKSLKELPKSIKGLKFLTHLNLSEYESLNELPESIKGLKFLTHLNLSGCKSLKKLPKGIKAFKSPTYIGPLVSVEVPINEPEEYLKLTKICMEQAENLTSSIRSSSLRFNHQQCKYLADKLKSVLKSADSFLCREERAYCLKIFKLLYGSAKEVEDFIQSHCVKDAWIQAAMLSTNVSDYVSAIAFDLELCGLVCSPSEILGERRSFTLASVDDVFKVEVGKVKEKAWDDRETLSKNLKAVQEKESETSVEFQFAALLLERLEGAKSSISVDIFHSRMAQLEEALLPRFRIKKQLGKGSAAVVFQATLLGGKVAVKTFEGLSNVDFNKEVSVLRGLSHPNIISLLCSGSYRRGKCSIIVELMDGDLACLMQKRIDEAQSKNDGNPQSPFDIMEAVDLMLQVGRGMEYLHEMKIVHRDLKAMNILVRRVTNHKGIEYVVAKVADFGLSKMKESTKTYSKQTLNQGTPRWMAPEMMKHCGKDKVPEYPFKTDIYSFGMVCFEILTGDTPFSEVEVPSEIRNLVLKGRRPSLPDQCPPSLKCLIERCWSADPTERPEFGKICAELRHLKCLLLMPFDMEEVEPAQSVNIEEVEPAQSVNIPDQVGCFDGFFMSVPERVGCFDGFFMCS